MADPPYGEIADLLRQGKVIPFLGAGVNRGTRPPEAAWRAGVNQFLPDGAELSYLLAEASSFPSQDDHEKRDLLKVGAYYVETSGRSRLRERLRTILDHDFDIGDIHTYLATIERPLFIVTTNYDDLTERAFRMAGKPYDLVVHLGDRKEWAASVLWYRHGSLAPEPTHPNKILLNPNVTMIYKMHGTVDRFSQRPVDEEDRAPQNWDSYVLTEDDYVDFLARMARQIAVPAKFIEHFHTRHFLFLGYSLNDWNLRVVLKNMRFAGRMRSRASAMDNGDEFRSWAVQFCPSPLEKELWRARDVLIYDVDINEFVRQIRTRVE